jgi:virulence factor
MGAAVERIRVGLVGGGAIARFAHLPALSEHAGVTIAGVVTGPPEEGEALIGRWPIEAAYRSAPEMIERGRLDALFVLTPKHLHVPFVELGLRHGLHVFCEKPLATSVDEARRLAEMAAEKGSVLMVGFNRRYAEVYRTAHEELSAAGVALCVAEKHRPDRFLRNTVENAIHMIDLLRWFGGEVDGVQASAMAPDPYHEIAVSGLFRFSAGGLGVLNAAYAAGQWDERLAVHGEGRSVRVIAPDAVEVTRDGQTRTVEMRPRAMGWAHAAESFGFWPEVRHFFDCVKRGTPPLTDGFEAVKTQELVEAVLRAASLPLDDPA